MFEVSPYWFLVKTNTKTWNGYTERKSWQSHDTRNMLWLWFPSCPIHIYPLWIYPKLSVFYTESTKYSLNKKEWICSLFKEWILEKSEIRVNLEWIRSEHLCYSLILEWPQGSLRDSEWSLRDSEWSLRSLQNEWITQMFTPNSLQIHSNFTLF